MSISELLIDWVERGYVPDAWTRAGIRRLLKQRLAKVDRGDPESNRHELERLIHEFRDSPIALLPEKANEQHYEVPAELFRLTLGPRLKYSSCWWPRDTENLAEAEEMALQETCDRAEIEDGMRILELGCGWGSLTLWMAEKYPSSKITAVSNSGSQREHILSEAKSRGIDQNLNVITCDMNEFETDQRFDRVVSVEMFEHMRNYQQLLNRISRWLAMDGKMFVHIFCHRELVYKFQDEGSTDWMSRYFFSGGIMPNDELLSWFQDDMSLVKRWRWNGMHYQKTCEAWLAKMDANRAPIMAVLEETYGKQDAKRWFNRWRMFYLACSELFGFNDGNEWYVAHYLFENGAKDQTRLELNDASAVQDDIQSCNTIRL